MKILISTPLFPPEVAYPAAFSKKLAKHLSVCGYDVVVATFSDFPEKVDGVEILHIKKSHHTFIRLILFWLLMMKTIPKQDVVILKQAGFSSFITLLVAKIFRVNTILKLKEDEVEVRIRNQKVNKDSFVIWRVKKLQQFIFKHVDFILFASEEIRDKILGEYNLNNVNLGVLEHPSTEDILHYGENIILDEKSRTDNNDWDLYVNEVAKKIKSYEK